jgi:hypothetical protein
MTFKEQFARLVDLKSMITIAIVATLVFLTVRSMTIDPFFSTIAGMVLGFYFGKAQTPTANTTTTTETTSTTSEEGGRK